MMSAQFIGNGGGFVINEGIEWLSNHGVSFHGARDDSIGCQWILILSNFELIGGDKRWEPSRVI